MNFNSKILNNKIILTFTRITLGIFFIISGIEKIVTPDHFAESISNYQMLPMFSINVFALVIPWIELLCGMLFLFELWVKESSFVLASLMLLFTAAVSIAFLRGLNIECGCFGTLNSSKVNMLKIFENIVLIIFILLTGFHIKYNHLKEDL